MFVRIFLISSFLLVSASAAGNVCKKFSEIYSDGSQMCTVMFSNSFIVPGTEDAYTMGFFDATNPNTDYSNKNNGQHRLAIFIRTLAKIIDSIASHRHKWQDSSRLHQPVDFAAQVQNRRLSDARSEGDGVGQLLPVLLLPRKVRAFHVVAPLKRFRLSLVPLL